MVNDTKKNEGPTCACGKVDLYEEWLKQNEDGGKEEASNPTNQAESQMSSSGTAGNGDTKLVQIKK